MEEEKVELDKWGDPIKKSKRIIRPLSLWAQREKFEFTVHLHNLTVIEDRNARFICGVSGGKTIEFVWHKDGRKIRFEKTPRILDYSADTRTACIGIECTQASDAGKYTCTFTDKATNQVLTTSCQLIVVPRFHKTKELAALVPPTFVRKLQCEFDQFKTFSIKTIAKLCNERFFRAQTRFKIKTFNAHNQSFLSLLTINSFLFSSYLCLHLSASSQINKNNQTLTNLTRTN